jgi:hypothetical protein
VEQGRNNNDDSIATHKIFIDVQIIRAYRA